MSTARHPEMNLRNLQDYTPYAVAREVFSRLLEQGRPSLDGDRCMYRSYDGAKCAVGLLLDDVDYSPNMERTSAGSVVRRLGLGAALGDPDYLSRGSYVALLQALQSTHDFTRHLVGQRGGFLSMLREGIEASGARGYYPGEDLRKALDAAAAERGLAVAQ